MNTTMTIVQSYIIPTVPVAPPLVPMKYSPLLNSSPVPAPLAPVLEPLPDVQRILDKTHKEQELKAKEDSVASKQRCSKESSSNYFIHFGSRRLVGLNSRCPGILCRND